MMKIKDIERFAKRKHIMLLLAGAAVCAGLGTTGLTSADSSTASGTVYHSPSTKIARETDLGENLSNHRFQSSQFDGLLVHQFRESDDSDIMRGGKLQSGPSDAVDKPHTTFEFKEGYVTALSHKSDTHWSDVSDAGNKGSLQNSSTMTYFMTAHDLFLREMFMRGDSHKALRIVKYHLHSVAKGANANQELIFYPIEFSYKNGSIHVIPKRQRSEYPMRLFVRNGEAKSTADGSSSNLLPD